MTRPTRGVVVNYYSLRESKLICQINRKRYKKNMSNKELTPEEIENIKEIEKILNKNKTFIQILPGSSAILYFPPVKPEVVTKPYQDTTFEQIRFIVREQNIDNKEIDNQEKFFYMGRRSTELVKDQFKQGNRLLKIERKGSGKDTLYIPTPVSDDKE